MRRTLLKRIVYNDPLENFIKGIVRHYLNKKSNQLIKKRGYPIAVFGNDWIGSSIFMSGIYEEHLIEDLFCVVNEVGFNLSKATIVDIGANIGNHSIQFSRKFKKVFSFEPNPRVYEILVSNTKRISNIETYNLGIGRNSAVLKLKENWMNMGGSSATMNVVSDSIVDIEISTLDSMVNLLGKVDVIKIDVEGMELDVLLGATEIISKNHPIICLEQDISEFKNEFNETASLDFLRSLGYRFYVQKTYEQLPWLVLRLKNIFEIVFGCRSQREILEFDRLPKKTYSMIFAIHCTSL